MAMPRQVTVDGLTHPDYMHRQLDWLKWRYTYEGGEQFIKRYLRKFSNRETAQDFIDRKVVTYCPSFAKAGIDEVKNSIYQRMSDITRTSGTDAYNKAVEGHNSGVDLRGSSMNSFIGQNVLTELLVMGRVGVYVDMPELQGASLSDAYKACPYLYSYRAEDIRNWIVDEKDPDQFQSVLLRDNTFAFDEKTGFPTGTKTRFRHLWRQDGQVHVQFYGDTGKEEGDIIVLNIDKIPFTVFQISNSLLTDIADYQIALLNLASSDIAFTLKANFPFYVEQYDARAEGSPFLRYEGQEHFDEDGNSVGEGTASVASEAHDNEIKVGASAGRRYPKDMDAPAFIHPSSEPMRASMDKQEQLKSEIRSLLNLGIANVRMAGQAPSAASKREESRGLEAGLSNIGMTLEKGEREIAKIWALYEGQVEATVKYPVNYSLRSEQDRRKEAVDLELLMKSIPSRTYQKEVGKQISNVMLGHYLTPDTLLEICEEIEAAPNMVSDPDTVAKDVENGLVSPKTASMLRGYPDGESELAEEAHSKRLARIALAQTSQKNQNLDAARGVPDMDSDPKKSGKEEKAVSRETDQDDTVTVKTRGKAKQLSTKGYND